MAFGPLISAQELRAGPEVTVLDVRWELGGPSGADAYAAGHIPDAVFVDLDSDLSGPPGPAGRHPLPDAAAFERSMRSAGVTRGRPVVVYDAGNAIAAARAWWVLRYFGHRDVAVLDGGLAAWLAAGGPLTREVPDVEPGDFAARAGGMPLLDAEGAAALARRGALLDARAPERFRGEVEPVDPVAGHIPGARNAPASATLAADGRYLEPRALRERFASAGVGDGVEVGAYCGSGVSAAQDVLALELAGIRAALYPGSWSEWITDSTREVARDD